MGCLFWLCSCYLYFVVPFLQVFIPRGCRSFTKGVQLYLSSSLFIAVILAYYLFGLHRTVFSLRFWIIRPLSTQLKFRSEFIQV